MWLTIVLVILY